MKTNLSICIPTMNRPAYLMQALSSIINQRKTDLLVEVCISNNASEENYSSVEELINGGEYSGLVINYCVQENRVSLDEHMHFVTGMATGDYVYFLGDDDYFQDDAFLVLEDLICKQEVDLAIFNADTVSSEGEILGRSFDGNARSYDRINEAFLDLKGKSTFGAVLVKRKYIKDTYFESLYGGSHAYTCFWVDMLNNIESKFKIVVPEQAVVFLRKAEKNYNFVNVYFADIPTHHRKFRQLVNTDEGKLLIDERSRIILNETKTIRFKVALLRNSSTYSELPSHSFGDKLINMLSYIISIDYVYDPLKYVIKLVRR